MYNFLCPKYIIYILFTLILFVLHGMKTSDCVQGKDFKAHCTVDVQDEKRSLLQHKIIISQFIKQAQ